MFAPDPLDADAIRAALAVKPLRRLGPIDCVASIDSTNGELLRRGGGQADGAVLIADAQTAGRGRRGREWCSPPGGNLYLSLYRRLARGTPPSGGLSLAVGVACAEALHALGFTEAQLKWPNDLWARGRKLGGVLIELSADAAVIGLGLNVRMPPGVELGQPWIDLAAMGTPPSRTTLAATVLEHLLLALDVFETDGFDALRARWEGLDALRGQQVRVHSGETQFDGRMLGLAADGGLRVQGPEGERVFHSADVSLRAS